MLKDMGIIIEQPQGFFDQGGLTQNEDGTMTVRLGGAGPTSQGTNRGLSALQSLMGAADTAQGITGQEPLQKGEREKIGLQGSIDLQKEIVKKTLEAEKAGKLKPNEIFTQYNKALGEFVKVRDAMGRIEASATDPSAAGDLALIFNYMKVLDPGSTVREGEFANAENSGAAWLKGARLYNKVLNGKRLTGGQRADFVDRSRKLFKKAEDQAAKTNKEFGSLATRNGIQPERILMDTGLAQPEQQGVVMVDAQGNRALVDPNTNTVIKEL